MADFIANSEPSLSKLLGDLRELWRQHRWLKVKVTAGKQRSPNQNDISHVWYEQVAMELREGTALDAKCECKLLHGCPILCAEDSDFRAAFDAAIRPLPYESQLEAMKYWPVTSLMTKPQISAYLEAVQKSYLRRGVVLEFPKERPRAFQK